MTMKHDVPLPDGTDLNDLAAGTWQGAGEPTQPDVEPEQLPDGSGLGELDEESAELHTES